MKKILILLVAFLGLVAFVYFYEIEGEKKREEAKQQEESLFRLEQEVISSVTVTRQGQPPVVLEKENESWFIREPLQTGADSTTVDSLLRNIADADRERTFKESEVSLAEVGLDNPRLTLEVGAGGEKKTLLVGKDDFTGNQVYVRFKDDPEIHLTTDFILTTSEKELLDWRSKKVFEFDRSKVQMVEITRPADKLVLQKEGENWKLESPLQEGADSSAVSTLLSSLEFAEAKSFVEEKPEQLAPYGLDKPAVTVRLREEGQDQWKTLQLGRAQGEEYLAYNPARAPVVTVAKDIHEKLTQDVWEFRDRDLMSVPQDQVSRLTIKRKGQPDLVIRHEDIDWIVEQPEAQKDKKALSYKFWYPIDDIRFTSLENQPGPFPEPAVEVVISSKAGETHTYQFAQAGEKYLARKAELNRQGAISKEDFDKLQFKVEDVLE